MKDTITMGWKVVERIVADRDAETIEDAIADNVLDYGEGGEVLAALLSGYGGGEFEERAWALLADMMRAHIDQTT